MLDNLFYFFFIPLVVTAPFVYRIIRLGKFTFFKKENDFPNNLNILIAEKVRFLQIILGYSYIIMHGIKYWGWLNIFTFQILSISISMFSELLGSKMGYIFGGKYNYEKDITPGPYIYGIPILIPISWAGLLYMSLNLASLLISGDIIGSDTRIDFWIILTSSFFMVILDMVLDPIAVDEKRWEWEKSGSYYNVPYLNFLSWFFVSLVIYYLFLLLSSLDVKTYYNDYLTKFSPGFLFLILPAIAARPCFERGLKFPGVLGLLFTITIFIILQLNK